jgi:hypothetical protein
VGSKAALIGAALLVAACVPTEPDRTDGRGAIYLTVQGSPSAKGEPIVTNDGWTIRLSRTVILARADIRSTRDSYGFGGGGSAIVDLHDTFIIRVRALEAGGYLVRGRLDWYVYGDVETSSSVTPEMAASFRERDASGPGANIRVIGTAESATGKRISFDWTLASVTFVESQNDDGQSTTVTVAGRERTDAAAEYDPAVLFRTSLMPSFQTVFDPVASADVNRDGWVTNGELDQAPVSSVYDPGLISPYNAKGTTSDNGSLGDILNELGSHGWR